MNRFLLNLDVFIALIRWQVIFARNAAEDLDTVRHFQNADFLTPTVAGILHRTLDV